MYRGDPLKLGDSANRCVLACLPRIAGGVALLALILLSGCAVGHKYVYTYARHDAQPSGVDAASRMLSEARYLVPTERVDLNDLLWVINDSSHVAVEFRGVWLPGYNERLSISDLSGQSCMLAFRAACRIFELRPKFSSGRIVLLPQRGEARPLPEWFQ